MRPSEIRPVPVWFETRWGMAVLAAAVCVATSVLLYCLGSYILLG